MNKETRNKEFLNLIGEEWKDHIQVYTDGSKQSDGVGSTYYIPSQEKYEKTTLTKHGSIFTIWKLIILSQKMLLSKLFW